MTLLVLAVAALAGCGSSGPKSNGEADKSAEQILADASAAASNASYVHVAGAQGTKLVLDLSLAAGKGGKGRVTANGLTFDMIRIGPTAYFKGDATFWRNFGGSGAAALMGNRWLKAPADTGQLSAFTPLTDIAKLFDGVLGSHGSLTKGDETTVNGVKVIGVRDATQGGTLYVATTGTPFPISIRNAGKGAINFDRWDEAFVLKAPAKAVDLSTLTG